MKRPTDVDLPFIIMHGEHEAWRQRCLIVGDFAPNRIPLSNYVSYKDGSMPEPTEPPKCAGCGEVPKVDDLDVVSVASGRRDFLDPYRDGTVRGGWPPPTAPETCWYCNGPERVEETDEVRLCWLCRDFLKDD